MSNQIVQEFDDAFADEVDSRQRPKNSRSSRFKRRTVRIFLAVVVVICVVLAIVLGVVLSRGSSPGSNVQTPPPVRSLPIPQFLPIDSRNAGLYVYDERLFIKGVNWFGAESESGIVDGLSVVSADDLIDFLSKNKFNAVRIPLSMQNVLQDRSIILTALDFGLNADFVPGNGSYPTVLSALDVLIGKLASRGILVMLANYRPLSADQTVPPLWYDGTYREEDIWRFWNILSGRYCNQWNVIAADLKNEPHGRATWGSQDIGTDWKQAAERLGNSILSVCPRMLVAVEGICPDDTTEFWGQHLAPSATSPVQLTNMMRVIYSPHMFAPGKRLISPFLDPSFPANMPREWNMSCKAVAISTDRAVIIGEWGAPYINDSLPVSTDDKEWMDAIVDYLFTSEMDLGFYYNFGANNVTGGLLFGDWKTPVGPKLRLLEGFPSTDITLLFSGKTRTPQPFPFAPTTPLADINSGGGPIPSSLMTSLPTQTASISSHVSIIGLFPTQTPFSFLVETTHPTETVLASPTPTPVSTPHTTPVTTPFSSSTHASSHSVTAYVSVTVTIISPTPSSVVVLPQDPDGGFITIIATPTTPTTSLVATTFLMSTTQMPSTISPSVIIHTQGTLSPPDTPTLRPIVTSLLPSPQTTSDAIHPISTQHAAPTNTYPTPSHVLQTPSLSQKTSTHGASRTRAAVTGIQTMNSARTVTVNIRTNLRTGLPSQTAAAPSTHAVTATSSKYTSTRTMTRKQTATKKQTATRKQTATIRTNTRSPSRSASRTPSRTSTPTRTYTATRTYTPTITRHLGICADPSLGNPCGLDCCPFSQDCCGTTPQFCCFGQTFCCGNQCIPGNLTANKCCQSS
mmetsp:Transcript_31320/g.50575  ORF Transcript_31320/g.50575 Transcript_31320/m.50575 type:complete len:854 (-) Transcript_31320:12-2573(-)